MLEELAGRGSEEEQRDGEEREVAAEVDEGMARGMAWRRETVVGAVYTATGETHFVHRSGIYRGGGERRERVGRVEARARPLVREEGQGVGGREG